MAKKTEPKTKETTPMAKKTEPKTKKPPEKKKRNAVCSQCSQPGHNARTCKVTKK